MFKLIGNVITGAAVIGAVKVYGKYKYYCGRRDSSKTWEIIVDAQSNLIDDLLDEKEEA